MNFIPPRPVDDGDPAAARFHQWVWDELVIHGRLIDTPHIQFSRTTKGIVPTIKPSQGGGSGASSAPVWL